MADRFRFEPDAAGIFEVSSGEAVKGILTQRFQDAAKKVRELAEEARRLLQLPEERQGPSSEEGRPRLRGRRRSGLPGWHLPEYGTSSITPTAPIRRGVRLAGLDFREGE